MKKMIDNDVLSTKSSNDWEYNADNDITFPRDVGGHVELTATDSIIGNSIVDFGIKGPTFDIKIPENSFNVGETGLSQDIGMCFIFDKDEFKKLGVNTGMIDFWIGDKAKKTGKLISISDEIGITEFTDGEEGDYKAWHPNSEVWLDNAAISGNVATLKIPDFGYNYPSALHVTFHTKLNEGTDYHPIIISGYIFQNATSTIVPIFLPNGNQTTLKVERSGNVGEYVVKLTFGEIDSNYQFVGGHLTF